MSIAPCDRLLFISLSTCYILYNAVIPENRDLQPVKNNDLQYISKTLG